VLPIGFQIDVARAQIPTYKSVAVVPYRAGSLYLSVRLSLRRKKGSKEEKVKKEGRENAKEDVPGKRRKCERTVAANTNP